MVAGLQAVIRWLVGFCKNQVSLIAERNVRQDMSVEDINKQPVDADNKAADAAVNDQAAAGVGGAEAEKDHTVFDSIYTKKKNVVADAVTADGATAAAGSDQIVDSAAVVTDGGADTPDAAAVGDTAEKGVEQPDYQAQIAELTDKLLRLEILRLNLWAM